MTFKIPEWDSNDTNSIEPSQGLKEDGFAANDALPAATFNWLMRQNGINWSLVDRMRVSLFQAGTKVLPSLNLDGASGLARIAGPAYPTQTDNMWITSQVSLPAASESLSVGRFTRSQQRGNTPSPVTEEGVIQTLIGAGTVSHFDARISVCGFSGSNSGSDVDDDRLFIVATNKDLANDSRRIFEIGSRTTSTTFLSTGPAWATTAGVLANLAGYNRYLRIAYVPQTTENIRAFPLGASDYGLTVNSNLFNGGETSRIAGSPFGTVVYDVAAVGGLLTSWHPEASPTSPVYQSTGSNLESVLESAAGVDFDGSKNVRFDWDGMLGEWRGVASIGQDLGDERLYYLVRNPSVNPHTGWEIVRELGLTDDSVKVSGEFAEPVDEILAVNGVLYTANRGLRFARVNAIFGTGAILVANIDQGANINATLAKGRLRSHKLVICRGKIYLCGRTLVEIPIL
jgi:hypothetical protein